MVKVTIITSLIKKLKGEEHALAGLRGASFFFCAMKACRSILSARPTRK